VKTQSPFFKGHFNFSFLAQRVHQKLGVRLSRYTVRRWAIKEGYFNPAIDTAAKAYVRFETGGIGMLFQHDSSIHVWVPLTKRKDVLIATIDDHSRKIVGACVVPKETTWHHLCVVRQTVESMGSPVAYYVDNHSIFRPEKKDPLTQFGRALKSLEIELKFTKVHYPQAKGKIEKYFDFLQRRLPFLCERYKISNLTQANRILLQEIIPYYNEIRIHAEIEEPPEKRWQRAIKEGRSYLKPLPEKTPLDLIFALHYERTLGGDGSFTFHGMRFVIPKAPRYKKVTLVLQPPYGPRQTKTRLTVLYHGSTLKQL
jgi:transposase InsO family protein